MKLITKELEKRFAKIGDQSQELDPIVVAKFFDPVGSASWFATEYAPEDRICFGYVKDLVQGEWNDEWGSFSIDKLEAIKRPLGLGIERDLHFNEKVFSEAVGRGYYERNCGSLEKIDAEKSKKLRLQKRQQEMEQMQSEPSPEQEIDLEM